jgi:hypothetical protein
MKHLKLPTFVVLTVIFLFASSAFAQKMTPEDIIAKHLDSIGTKEKRSEIKNQTMLGDIQLIIKGTAITLDGKAVIFSAAEKSLWGLNLNSNDYPTDRFGYNGKETKVAFIRPGTRSILGGFIYSYGELLKEGLLGGTLTSSWALLNVDSKNPKLSYEGTKKIDNKEAYAISYSPKKGSDLDIKMYFDTKTFQHVRTEYNRVIGARQGGSVDSSAGQGEDRYRLVEDFSDFKKAGNLVLPSIYKISYSYSSSAATRVRQNANTEIGLTFNLVNYSYNQQIDDSSFEVGRK